VLVPPRADVIAGGRQRPAMPKTMALRGQPDTFGATT
jgi:hypothetical protein